MRRFILLVAILASASTANAQWGVTIGPGVNPELDSWYSDWTTIQNGGIVTLHTPATVAQCRLELHAIMRDHPPITSPEGTPFTDRWIIYHPAYQEARHILDWMWSWPAKKP